MTFKSMSSNGSTSPAWIDFALIFVFGVVAHWFLKSGITISNSDDALSMYRGFTAFRGADTAFFSTASDLAQKQGRFYFAYTDFFSMLPYLLEPEWLRALVNAVVYVLCGFAAAYLCFVFYADLKACKLFLIVYLSSIPVYSAWYAYYHWPLYWLTPVIVFSISVFFWIAMQNTKSWLAQMASAVVYLTFCCLAILFSEMYFISFGVLMALLLVVRILPAQSVLSYRDIPTKLMQRWRLTLFTFTPFIIFITFYVTFLLLRADQVNRVSSKLGLNFNPLDAAKAFGTFGVNAIPINLITMEQAARFVGSTLALAAGGGHSEPLIMLTALLLFAGLIAFYFVTRLMGPVEHSARQAEFVESKLYSKSALLWLAPTLIGFLFVTLHSLTFAYQNWLSNFRPWYTPGFFVSMGLMMSACLMLTARIRKQARSGGRHRLEMVVLFFVVLCCVAVNTFSTLAVRDSLRQNNIVWNLFLKFSQSRVAVHINSAETVFIDSTLPVPFAKREGRRSLVINEMFGTSARFVDSTTDLQAPVDRVIHVSGEVNYEKAFLAVGVPLSKERAPWRFNEISIVPLAGFAHRRIRIRSPNHCYMDVKVRGRADGLTATTDEPFSFEDIELSHRPLFKLDNC